MNILRKSVVSVYNYFKNCSLVKTYWCANVFPRSKTTDVQPDHDAEKEYNSSADACLRYSSFHNCLVVHPYIKWGRGKLRDTSPEKRLQEAIALIKTLVLWKVHNTVIVPLTGFHKITLVGKGTLGKLRAQIQSSPGITAVHINVGRLKNKQLRRLEAEFGVPVLDRFKVVMHILKLHATSTHAKLQVELAEVSYLKARLRRDDFSTTITSTNYDIRNRVLQNREQKLRNAIGRLQAQRQLNRERRKKLDYPTVAVVGYTNAGKTSLIKALTGNQSLKPKDSLFATLDVTLHAGLLPSTMKVLYVDTVGFISDIPTTLIECFIVTLEDAMFADVIIHVEDLSNEDLIHQRNHVLLTLSRLAEKSGCYQILNKIIRVGNKCDLVAPNCLPDDTIAVSSTQYIGLDQLRSKLERVILENTDRKLLTLRVASNGEEMRWLYKNATVILVAADEMDVRYQIMKVIISTSKLSQFKHFFLKQMPSW